MTPLTEEQRALWVAWIPYSQRVASGFIRAHPQHRHLAHRFYDAAMGAGEKAVQAWVPSRGTYASCLHWWVLAALRQVVLEERRAEQRTVSLDAVLGEEGDTTRHEVVEDVSVVDPVVRLDTAGLMARAEAELVRRLRRSGGMRPGRAEETARLFLECRFRGAYASDAARAEGVKPQTVSMRIQKAQRFFEEWARELREEAA